MTEKDSKAYMYVVECADGTLYTGYTTDVERRAKPITRAGAKYTKPATTLTPAQKPSLASLKP